MSDICVSHVWILYLIAVLLRNIAMRRISIDTLGLMSPKTGATFEAAKRKRLCYSSRSRLLATFLVFAVLWTWLSLKADVVPIPEDSFEYLKDDSLRDILNSTLGVGQLLMTYVLSTNAQNNTRITVLSCCRQ